MRQWSHLQESQRASTTPVSHIAFKILGDALHAKKLAFMQRLEAKLNNSTATVP